MYYEWDALTREEAIMEPLLLIIGIVAAALLLLRPAPRTQVIYVPMEVVKARSRLGCLPLIVAAILVLLALLAPGGTSN